MKNNFRCFISFSFCIIKTQIYEYEYKKNLLKIKAFIQNALQKMYNQNYLISVNFYFL